MVQDEKKKKEEEERKKERKNELRYTFDNVRD